MPLITILKMSGGAYFFLFQIQYESYSKSKAAARSKSQSTDFRTFSQIFFSATPIRYNLSTFKFFTATEVSQLAASNAVRH